MTGRPGKWPWKNHSVAVTALIPTIRFASGSYSTIRSTSRNGQRCGMSASISRVVWIVVGAGPPEAEAEASGSAGAVEASAASWSVTGGSMCAEGKGKSDGSGGPLSSAFRRGKEGGAADPVEQVGRHPALEEGLVAQEGAVDRRRS